MLTQPTQPLAGRLCGDSAGPARPLVGLLLAAILAASASVARAQEEDVALTVKPVLCVTDRPEDGCTLSITISWQSSDKGEYCLHSDLADEPLRCWRSADSGTVVEERVIRETFSYWLTDGASEVRLGEATLEVLSTESDDRRRNRRRRHVWDIL